MKALLPTIHKLYLLIHSDIKYLIKSYNDCSFYLYLILLTIAVHFHSLIVCIFKSCKLLWYYHKGFEILFALMQFERQNIIKIKSSIPHVHVSKTNWLSRLNTEEYGTCSSHILSFFCAAYTCIRYKKKINVTSMPYFLSKSGCQYF